jgi:hypothetical protein
MSRAYENAQNYYRPRGAAEWRKYRAEQAWRIALESVGQAPNANTEADADSIMLFVTDAEAGDPRVVCEESSLVAWGIHLLQSEQMMIDKGVLDKNGGLISYASYKNTNSGKPLSAEEVCDLESYIDPFDADI